MNSPAVDMEGAWSQVRVAMGKERADLAITNCRIVNVYSGEVHRGDIAIRQGAIVALREQPEIQAEASIDARHAYAAPGFVIPPPGRTEPPCRTADEALGQLRLGNHPFLQVGESALEILNALTERGIDISRVCLIHGNPSWTREANPAALAWSRFAAGAIGIGIAPAMLFAMSSLNPSIVYSQDHRVGSISPGRSADLLLFEDFDRFSPALVLGSGKVVHGPDFLHGSG
jgi:adenine deaminase